MTNAIKKLLQLKMSMKQLTDSPAAQSQTKRKKSAAPTSAEPELDFQWPLEEEEFVITLEEDGWNLRSVQSYNQEQDTIVFKPSTL